MAVTGFMLLASALLFYAAFTAAFKYRTARLFSIEGLLRKNHDAGGTKEPQTKVTTGFISQLESNDVENRRKITSSIHTETETTK
jgi:hypothetical protein